MKNIFMLILIFIIQSVFGAPNVGSLPAGNDISWKPLGPSGGGYYEAVTISPSDPNMICIGTDVGGFFLSLDGGSSWESRSNGLTDYFIERIAIHPTNTSIILLATAGGIFRSTDKGLNWTWIRSGFPPPSESGYSAPINVICFDPQDPNIAFAGQGRTRGDLNNGGTRSGNIYKSTDTGVTWQVVSTGQTNQNAIISDIAVKESDSNIILASSDYGIYKSSDGGSTWVLENSGLNNLNVSRISWSKSKTGKVFITVKTTARDSETWNGGIYVSNNSGSNWSNISGNFPSVVGSSSSSDLMTTTPMSIIAHPNDKDTVYVANFSWLYRGIYKTSDNGTTWTNLITSSNVTTGWADIIIGAPFCMSMYGGDPGIIFFGDSMQLYITENGGASWQQKYCEMLPDGSFKGNGADVLCIDDIVFDENDPDRIYFCAWDKGLLISDDKGDSYHHANIDGHVYTISVDAEKSPRVIWAAANFAPKMRVSYDDGNTWVSCTNGLPSGNIKTIIMDPTSNINSRRLLITVSGHGIYESTDGGNSWNSINGNLPSGAVTEPRGLILDSLDSEHLIAAFGGAPSNGSGIYETNDGGTNWTKINTSDLFYDIYSLKADPKDIDNLYIAQRYTWFNGNSYSGGVFKSTDGGVTWELILSGEIANDVSVNPVNSNVLYATFSQLPFHDNSVGEGVVKSTDRGLTWQKEWGGLSCLNSSVVKISPHNPEEVYVGSSGASSFIGLDECVIPMIQWKFDEANFSSMALDSSGFDRDGIITGNGVRSNGIAGSAIELENGEKISYTGPSLNNRREAVTISSWSKMIATGTQTNSFIMWKVNSYYIKQGWGGGITFTVHVDGTAYSTQGYHPVTEGEWYHILGSYDSNTKSMKLYIDGVCVEEYVLPSGLSSYLIDDTSSTIDTIVAGNGTTRTIAYDDMRLYNYALSEYDIRIISDRNMILNIKFEDPEGSIDIIDDSIFACDGTINSIMDPIAGKIGNAVVLEDNTQINFNSSGLQLSQDALSVCGWVYIAVDGNQDNSYLFSKYQSFGLISGWGRNTRFEIKIDSATHSTSAYNLSIGSWHHVAGTYSSNSKELRIYIDGVLKETKTLFGLSNYKIDSSIYSGVIGVGGNDGRVVYYDDIRLYNRVLTVNEVSTIASEL